MAPIVRPIKKVIRWVGDTIEDAADWVIDEIVDPVVDTVGNVIDSALDDPVKSIATVAAIATGNAWAIPLIEGADVAIEGGDIGDVLEATAKAYVAQQVGAKVGSYAGSEAAASAAEAGASAGQQAVARAVVGSGAARASQAIVYGQDPVEAFAKGGISGGISASLGQLEQNSAYKDLPQAAKNVIADTLTATLTGGEVTPELITSAIVRGTVTANLVAEQIDPVQYNEFGDELPGKFTDGQIAAITNAIVNTSTAAFTGKDITPALMKSVLQYGSEELNKSLDKNVRNTIDKVSGDYEALETKAGQVDDAVSDYETAAANYNAVADQMRPRFDERSRLLGLVDTARENLKANENQGTVDAYNSAIKTYNDYTVALDNDYANKFKPLLDRYKAESDTALNSVNTFRDEYNVLKNNLVSSGDQLDDALVPVQQSIDKAFVRAMTGDTFLSEEYIKVNNLDDDAAAAGEDFDPHYHWLTQGKNEQLPVNQEQYNEALRLEREDFKEKALASANLNISHLSKNQIQLLDKDLTEMYGDNLQAIKNADPDNYAREITQQYLREQDFIKDLLKQEFNYTDAQIEQYINNRNSVDENIHTLSRYPKSVISKNNVTEKDIASDNVILAASSDGTLGYVKKEVRDTSFYWDNTFGKRVRRQATNDGYNIVDEEGNIELTVETLPKLTPSELLKTNPEAGITTYAELQDAEARKIVEAGVGSTTWTFIQKAYEYARREDAPDFLKDTAGVVLSAGGELIDSFNGLLILADINPETTKAGKFARKLIKMGDDVKTEEYKNNVQEIQQIINDANKDTDPDAPWYERAWNTTKAIYDGASKAPLTFAAEYIAKEVIQEVPLLLLSGGTANVAKKVLMEGGEAYAKNIAMKVGVGTSVTASMAEGFGGTAVETFNEAYRTAIKSGMDEEQATEYSFDLAKEAGTISAITTLATGKVLKGNDFERILFGNKKKGNIAEAFEVIGKETVQEGFEEGLPKAWSETKLVQIDPTRDTVGSITANTILGMISGGGTATTIYGTVEGYNAVQNKLNVITTGDFVSSAIANFNPEVSSVIENTNKTPENMSVLERDLTDLGIDSNTQANILNNFYNESYTSTEEVYDKYREFGDYRPEQSEVDRFVGKTSDEKFSTDFDAYIDPRFVDKQEILDVAKSEGVTLTDDQINQYVGQKDEAALLEQARKDLDPTAVTEAEARKYLTDLGYTPTDAEVAQFTAQIAETEQAKAIGEYVDPRMTSADEAKSYFDALGYVATDDEINSYVGQIEEIKQRVAIGEYVDPRLVSETEAFEAFKDAGLADVRPEDARKLMGQYDQTLLGGKVEEALPEAKFNVLKYMVGSPATDTTPATGIFAELQNVKESPEIKSQLDALSTALGAQEQNITDVTDIIGRPATDTDQATGLFATAQDANQQLADQITNLQQQQASFQQQQTDFAQDFIKQYEQQAEDEARRRAAAAQRGQQMDLARQLYQGLQPQQLTPLKPVEVAQIGAPYQFESIFRDAGQEAFYQTPYNKGGQVNDLNDTLLKLIGDD